MSYQTEKQEHRLERKTTSRVRPTRFGWPTTGGVWVLKPTEEQFDAFNRSPTTTGMNEHCRMLQEIGATFYGDPVQSEEARAAMGR
jgi:hypothetical protein